MEDSGDDVYHTMVLFTTDVYHVSRAGAWGV